ncbi:MAG: putative quinol monooxygenase [Pseudomonadota bacterium]
MYVVTVTFQIQPENLDTFLPLMDAQAKNSLALEEGCLQFQVCQSDDPGEIFLYELYTSPAAFELHLNSDHFKSFDAEVSDMVTYKNVATYTLR